MARYAEGTIQVVNMATSIPTLGKLALMMSLLGIGALPAIVGLWIATLLPIIRNTYEGIRAVPPSMVDAAQGMGMGPRDILRRVELPNALFVIFAGVRTAMAVNVGTAPIAFLIGGGGLGELIFTGIDLQEHGMMLAGAIPTALLAVAVDFLFGQAQYWLVPRGVNPLAECLDSTTEEMTMNSVTRAAATGLIALRARMHGQRADDRRRRQGLHRAADHDGDDGRAAQGQGLHAGAQGRHGQRRGARRRSRTARSTCTGNTPAPA